MKYAIIPLGFFSRFGRFITQHCMVTSSLLTVAVAVLAAPARGETTYWLPSMTATTTETIYTYGTKLPTDFGGKLAEKGQAVTHEVDGKTHNFVKVSVDWDANPTANANPAKRGKVSIHVPNGFGYGWLDDYTSLRDDATAVAALDTASTLQPNGWRVADLLVLKAEGDKNPGLVLRFPISEADQIKARMRAIAETTVGAVYPTQTRGEDRVKVPQDLDAMRREMLALGNLGRRDPDFRKNNKYARDLSGDTTTGERGPEKVFHDNPTPPYFNDLVLHPQLNDAAQWMAEYYARTDGNARQPAGGPKHIAPGATWKGAKMDTLTTRLEFFAKGVGTAGEGLAGPDAADAAPENWMHTETHYRPWFNIGANVKSMGLGAARTEKGWYFCKIGGTDLPQGVSQPTPAAPDPAAPVAAAPVAEGKEVKMPLAVGTKIEKGIRYVSSDGKHYLSFQDDNNVVIYRTADNGYVWSLVDEPGVDYKKAASVELAPDGPERFWFGVFDADGKKLFARNISSPSGTSLDISADGKLIGAKSR